VRWERFVSPIPYFLSKIAVYRFILNAFEIYRPYYQLFLSSCHFYICKINIHNTDELRRYKRPSMRCINRSILTSLHLLLLISSFLVVRFGFCSFVSVLVLIPAACALLCIQYSCSDHVSTDAVDINVSPDKRTLFLHSEDKFVAALKVRFNSVFVIAVIIISND